MANIAYCNETAHLFEHWDERAGVDVQLHHRAESDFAALPDFELLALLIRRKCGPAVAKNLLRRFGSLADVFAAPLADLVSVAGMDRATATELKTVHEATMRIQRREAARRPVMSSWSALVAYAKTAMAGEPREQVRILFLDKRNQLIADEVTNEGTVDHAPVYPREVMRRALELSATAIILAHNHPSGDPSPSPADVALTRKVVEAGKVMGVLVHDHIVVGRDGVASFKALGLL